MAFLLSGVLCLGMGGGPSGRPPAGSTAGPSGTLDQLERAAFRYFWEQRDGHSGLVYNTTEPHAPASPTAAGVALSAIPVGIERGWITRNEGYQRAAQLLRTLGRLNEVHGFFYHFLDARTGGRTWDSEVSCIDSAILFAGAAVIAGYFAGTEVEQLANQLIDRADWPWFLNGEDRLFWGWRPDTGFEGGPMDFSESVLAHLLALGSPTHPVPADTWRALRRPVTRSYGGGPRMVYTRDGSLFAYLLPLVWFDLRDRHDLYLDYWTNARTALRSNMAFCQAQGARFRAYREGLWGLSAALGPEGYQAYGAPPGVAIAHDGTVAPYVVAAAIPLMPDEATATLRRLEALSPSLWTRYGWGDGLNLDRHFACPHTIALDQGMVLLMIENYRTGLIWNLFMRHPVARRAVAAAGFTVGAQEEPSSEAVAAGNPGASVTVPMMDHAVTVDADLTEWIQRDAIEVTPTNRRHIESGMFRSAQDASAVVYLGWSESAFYVAGIVMDDERVARKRAAQIYEDDCVELYWDLDGDGFRFDGNPRDVQIGLAPSGPEGSPQLWAWGALQRAPQDTAWALKDEGGRFLFELAIPRALLPGLSEGRPVRFSVAYHDRDTDGKEGKLHWSIDTASVPGRIQFGELRLGPAPVIAPSPSHSGPGGDRRE